MKNLLGLLLILPLLAGCATPLKPAANVPATLYLPNRILVDAGHEDRCEWEFPAGPYHLIGENKVGVYYQPEKPVLMPNPNQGDLAKAIQGERIAVKNGGVVVPHSEFHDAYAVADKAWITPMIFVGSKPGLAQKLGGRVFLSKTPGEIRRSDWWRE